MEYHRTNDGQIHADFSRRVGQVILQYEKLSLQLPIEQRYEATLCLAMLQSQLTAAAEILNSKARLRSNSFGLYASRRIAEEPALMGIEASCIQTCWVPGQTTYRQLLESLRHSMSHPLPQIEQELSVTGFTAWEAENGVVEGYTFVHSPFVSARGRNPKLAFTASPEDARAVRTLQEKCKTWESNYHIVGLQIKEAKDGSLQIFQNDMPFVPVMTIGMSTLQLRTFTLALCDFMSEQLSSKTSQAIGAEAT
jgi:hypothetical protein